MLQSTTSVSLLCWGTTPKHNDNATSAAEEHDNDDENSIEYYLVYPLQSTYKARVDLEKQSYDTCMQKVETKHVPVCVAGGVLHAHDGA